MTLPNRLQLSEFKLLSIKSAGKDTTKTSSWQAKQEKEWASSSCFPVRFTPRCGLWEERGQREKSFIRIGDYIISQLFSSFVLLFQEKSLTLQRAWWFCLSLIAALWNDGTTPWNLLNGRTFLTQEPVFRVSIMWEPALCVQYRRQQVSACGSREVYHRIYLSAHTVNMTKCSTIYY